MPEVLGLTPDSNKEFLKIQCPPKVWRTVSVFLKLIIILLNSDTNVYVITTWN